MKLRYQMRGLGIGIIVTALLMGFATREKIPLSDAEIRAKALELGMVESDSLKLTDLQNIQPSSTPGSVQQDGEGAGPGSQEEPQEGEAVPDEDVPEEGSHALGEDAMGESSQASESSSEPDRESEEEQGWESSEVQQPGTGEGAEEPDDYQPDENGIVTVVIELGMDSYSVCQLLAQAGLVEDANTFDDYINSLGYSRSVRAGTYGIPMGTDEEEIAKIITGNR